MLTIALLALLATPDAAADAPQASPAPRYMRGQVLRVVAPVDGVTVRSISDAEIKAAKRREAAEMAHFMAVEMLATTWLQKPANRRIAWSAVICNAMTELLGEGNTTRAGRLYLQGLVVKGTAALEKQDTKPFPCAVYLCDEAGEHCSKPVEKIAACLDILPPVGCHTDSELEVQTRAAEMLQ